MTKKTILFLLAVFAFSAVAAEEDNVQTQNVQSVKEETSFFQSIREKLSAKYIFEVSGPSLEALDGVADDGHNIGIVQYLSLGYKLGEKTKLTLTQYFQNSIRSESVGRNLSLGDPYLTFSHSSLKKFGKLNIAAYLRYYFPTSRKTAASAGGEKDEKNGKLRINVLPSMEISDLVSVGASMNFYKPFSRYELREGDNRRDLYVWIYPYISVKVSEKLRYYVAYSNVYTHTKDKADKGAWNDWATSESLELGAHWKAMDKLALSPYINFNAPKWLDPASISMSVYATYSFL